MAVREIDLAGEQGRVEGVGPRAVDDDVPAPAVEDVAVRVGEVVGDVHLELLGARLVAEDAGVAQCSHRRPGRLHRGVVEGPLLEVEVAARAEDEAVGGVVRVGRVEAVEHPHARCRRVVAVGVLEDTSRPAPGHTITPLL